MQSFRTDLHIHTVLSPCGDPEMSPARIVAAAKSRGLDIIGITDHNSTQQCRLIWDLGRKAGLTVIPGCEATTREEVHCLTLFPDFEALSEFQRFVERQLTYVPNDPALFGYQLVVDENDNVKKEFHNYLGASLDASIQEVELKVHELSGIFIPAHVDRPRNSLFSQLGFLPCELMVDALQISKLAEEKAVRERYRISPEIALVKFSDAHFLADIGKTWTNFRMESPSFVEIRKALLGLEGRRTFIP